MSDLLNAGAFRAGMALTPRPAKFRNGAAVLLPDGQIELEGKIFAHPAVAAAYLTGQATNGWSFFLVDSKSKTSLRRIRSEYLGSLDADLDDDEEDDDDE